MKQINLFIKTFTIAFCIMLCCLQVNAQTSVHKSAYFNGTNSAIFENNLANFLDNTTHPKLTAEAWVKEDSINSNIKTVIQMGAAGSYPPVNSCNYDVINISIKGDSICAAYGDTINKFTLFAAGAITDTNWHHIALICDTSGYALSAYPWWTSYDSLTLYVDGTNIAYSTHIKHIECALSSGGNTNIGISYSGVGSCAAHPLNAFKGHIARVVITDSILYTSTFVPDCVFDTVSMMNDSISYPTLTMLPLNGNDTVYYYNGAKVYYLPNTYTYEASPCAPLYAFYRLAGSSNDTLIADNSNKSYLKGAHLIHYNGWTNNPTTISYGLFSDSLIVTTGTDSIYYYYSNYYNDTIKSDTIVVSPTFVNTIDRSDISVFPLPANNYLNINCTGFINAEVIDFTGKSLLKSTNKRLSISNLPAGNYLLKINTLNGFVADKILILH